MIGTSKILTGFKHIHMLNGYSFPNDKNTLFKYMPLDRFVKSVDNKELVFVSPKTWYDPFEQLYYGIDCSSRGYDTDDIVCMCVSTKSSTNEDASWRVYAGTNNKTVRISIDRDKLLSLLESFAESKGYEVYIGKVNYDFDKKDIKNIHHISSPLYSGYFPQVMKVEHYLSLMLLKRSSFKYENEVRLFLVKQTIPEQLLKIECDYKKTGLVSSIMLSPYPPVRESDDLVYKVREKMNDIESRQLKILLKSKVGCLIQQSLLYKVLPSMKKV